MSQEYADALATLDAAQSNHELSIIKLSTELTTTLNHATSTTDIHDPITPSSLEADLTHYKDLFSKLRFSYVEQVTKEKFIRAIVNDPPLVVESSDNVELEAQLAVTKRQLKEQKNEVAEMLRELERQGRDLARRHTQIQLQTAQLRDLPLEIELLEGSIELLRSKQAPGPDPLMNMPLEKTIALAEEKERELADLDRQLEQLQASLPRKTLDLEHLKSELQGLEVRRAGTTASAREARRRKEAALGGAGDDLEERGRWWRGVEMGLRSMLAVEQ